MGLRAAVLAGLLLALPTTLARAQQPPGVSQPFEVPDSAVTRHRLTRPAPIRSSQWTRSLAFQAVMVVLVVNQEGRVASAKAAEGPQQFYGKAEAEARGWRYRPFTKDGQPVAVTFSEYIHILPPEILPAKHVPFPAVKQWDSLRITLQRTACFGTCPSYQVEIDGDGTVTYTGREFVAVTGEHRDRIARKAVLALVDAFRRADYFSLRDSYWASVSDNPTYTTSIAFDGNKKSVSDYVGATIGMPQAITDLEEAIDRVAGTAKWVKGNEETVESLRKEGFDFHSEAAVRLLVRAAQTATPKCVSDLIDAGVPLDGRGPGGVTALEEAARRSDDQIATRLIRAGAEASDPEAKTSALYWAARHGHLGLVRLLIRYGGNPRGAIRGHGNILCAAAASGMADVVAEILRYHPELNAVDSEGNTPILLAAQPGYNDDERKINRAGAILLLIKAGAEVNARNKSGSTALQGTDEAETRTLLENGADPNVAGVDGETPLMHAESAAVARLLVAAGANPNAVDRWGRTALDLARQEGRKDVARYLEPLTRPEKRKGASR